MDGENWWRGKQNLRIWSGYLQCAGTTIVKVRVYVPCIWYGEILLSEDAPVYAGSTCASRTTLYIGKPERSVSLVLKCDRFLCRFEAFGLSALVVLVLLDGGLGSAEGQRGAADTALDGILADFLDHRLLAKLPHLIQ